MRAEVIVQFVVPVVHGLSRYHTVMVGFALLGMAHALSTSYVFTLLHVSVYFYFLLGKQNGTTGLSSSSEEVGDSREGFFVHSAFSSILDFSYGDSQELKHVYHFLVETQL